MAHRPHAREEYEGYAVIRVFREIRGCGVCIYVSIVNLWY
jgi:hypothetical protein